MNGPTTAPVPDANGSGLATYYAWKFVGAMWMEEKGGTWAFSLNRVLGTVTFVVCLYLWLTAYEIPDGLVYTMWGMLGINGGKSLANVGVKGLQSVAETLASKKKGKAAK